MKLLKDYIDYLKDNPEGYWFKSKLYGYGWTPAKPAGWLVIGVYIVFLLGVIFYAQSSGLGDNEIPTRLILVIVGATILLLVITWRTGEPLKWQWGQKHEK